MIKASEIIVGRLFNVPREDQSPFRIDTIEYLSGNFGKVGMYPTIDGKIRDDLHPLTWYIEHLSPIPLSPEWLERAGFTKSNNKTKDLWYKEFKREHEELSSYFFIGKLKEDPTNMYYCGFENPLRAVNINNIYFVHQVQNGYHFLTCGEELTFKPAPAGSGE